MTAMHAIAALLVLLSPAAARSRPPSAAADYVVVGGGTAGCVVAARLCEALPYATVALLERGAERNETSEALIQSMRLVGEAWKNPDLVEVFQSLPGAGVGDRSLPIITGATLGGSSSINAGQWTTPGIEEASGWGFPGFTGSAAEEYYKRVAAKVCPAVPPPDLQQRYLNTWIEGAATAGIPTDVDPLRLTTEKPTFATYTPIAADETGMRRDSCSVYLEPVMHGKCRHNLKLVQGAVVSKIQKDEPEERQERRIKARRGVVSCAGPYGSPKLLQLSGIGPAPLLHDLGVPVVKDLPVGQATQGRVVAPIVDFYTAVPLAPEANTSIIFSDAAAATFAAGGGGPLGISIAGLVGTLRKDKCLLGGTVAIGSQFLNLPAMLIYGLPDAQSRGTLQITPDTVRNPMAPPAVNLSLLTAPGEAADVAQCMNRLQSVNDVIRQELGLLNILPGNMAVNESFVRQQSDNSYHYSAGCAVGSVVDGKFRVHGVSNLRVVDASVIPKLTDGAGPMASVYALAEHAAELIIAEEVGWAGFQGRRPRWVRRRRSVRPRTGPMSEMVSSRGVATFSFVDEKGT